MSWRVTLDGRSYLSDDLTLDEVEAVERVSGTPWAIMNPLQSIPGAKGMLAVFMLRDGLDDDEKIRAALAGFTLRQIKTAFRWIPDEKPPPETSGGGDPVPPSSGPSDGGTSPGARPGSDGPRPSLAGSVSAT